MRARGLDGCRYGSLKWVFLTAVDLATQILSSQFPKDLFCVMKLLKIPFHGNSNEAANDRVYPI
jgi:hypothetical protein